MVIVKNNTASNLNVFSLGLIVPASNQIELQNTDRFRAASSDVIAEVTTLMNSGDVTINDGEEDLSTTAAILHLGFAMDRVHTPIEWNPPVGENAPEVIALNGATFGFSFVLGSELFGFTHLDNPILTEPIEIQIHAAIDNAIADRWIQFEITVLTTNGIGDKQLNTHDLVLEFDPKEVPTTPFLIFDTKITLPDSLFQNDEDNIFFKIKRITPTGKTAPTNNPAIVRLDKIYKRRRVF